MPAYTFDSRVVDLTGIASAQYGARLKRIVDNIMDMCPELAVETQSSSTPTTTYNATFSWCGSDIFGYLGVSNGVIACGRRYLGLNGKTYMPSNPGSASKIPLTDETVSIEVVRYSDVFIIVSIVSGSNPNYIVTNMFMRVVDKFSTSEKYVHYVGSDTSGLYPFGTYYSRSKYTDSIVGHYVRPYINVDALPPDGLYHVVPISFNTGANDDATLSFPSGDCRFYYVYLSTDQHNFAERLMRFSVGGKNFITLSSTVCLRID